MSCARFPQWPTCWGSSCESVASDAASSAVTDNGTVVRGWRERSTFMPLTADERDWFLAFSDAAHVVRMSEGVIEGDTVKGDARTPHGPRGPYSQDRSA